MRAMMRTSHDEVYAFEVAFTEKVTEVDRLAFEWRGCIGVGGLLKNEINLGAKPLFVRVANEPIAEDTMALMLP